MKISSLAFLTALAISAPAIADDMKKPVAADKAKAAPAKLADEDIKLIAHIHAVNMMEVDMGNLAQKMGASAGVKKYGADLVKDHGTGDKDLVAFAAARGVAKIPADVPPNEAAKKEHDEMMAKMAELKKLKGADFDRQFLTLMEAGHTSELGKLKTATPNIKDTDLRAKMTDLQPVLQRHADTARDLLKAAPAASK
jgi:putative membrane protein